MLSFRFEWTALSIRSRYCPSNYGSSVPLRVLSPQCLTSCTNLPPSAPSPPQTSLCKALAHKFAVRSSSLYRDFQLIEINAHSLFSKWFSESGKLVLKLFDGIREFAADPQHLVFVLIDEVESLAYDRQRFTAADPTDAMRVVNALLTQIDSIKRYPNVIILASSNVTDAMDDAFVDRVDMKQFIGLPSVCAVYRILSHCVFELTNNGIIAQEGEAGQSHSHLLPYSRVVHHEVLLENDEFSSTDCISNVARKCSEDGVSLGSSMPALHSSSSSDSGSFASGSKSQFVVLDGSSSPPEMTPNQPFVGAPDAPEVMELKVLEESVRLLSLCRRCVSFSGRTLRKLPFLAIALFSDCSALLGQHGGEAGDRRPVMTLTEFFQSLEKAIDKQLADNKHFKC